MPESGPLVPEASATLEVAPRTTTAQVFECARQRLAQLRGEDALWDHPVTREDPAQGVLETGHFPDDNITGFRLHLQHDAGAGSVALRLRGAGAYFVDQGVEAGLDTFEDGFTQCLSPR